MYLKKIIAQGFKSFADNTVIDLDSDFKYEIIVSCGYYSIQNRSDKLYTFKNNEFQLLASNE